MSKPEAKPAQLPGKKPALPPGKAAKPPGKSAQLPGKAAAGPKLPPAAPKKKKSKIEAIKEQSSGLRGPLAEEVRQETDHFGEAAKQLLKFHGVYQQDDRDNRQGGKDYMFMVRSKLPGGRLTAEQYLVHEALAERYANGTLRITTRESFQLHGIIKGDLQAAIKELNESLVTTLGACGDVVRNVMCCPAPVDDPVQQAIEAVSQEISDYLLPQTRAYHEIWVDGEKVYNGKAHVETKDPIYGTAYLPRKFKIGIAAPGDNCIDVYTQDVGLVAVVEDGTLKGFNVLVGGGLGMTHKKPETFPRLADPLAFITPEEVIPVVEQIVLIQRDHGDRADRKHARMKYLIHDWGIDRFRKELEKRLGYTLPTPAPMPPFELELHLGWHEQGDGHWYLGLSVENGRIQDEGALRLKSGLHEVIGRFRPGIRLTPNQDILLTGLRAEDRAAVELTLQAHGIRLEGELSNARKLSMACPALPTCGLALTESERVLPSVIDQFEAELERLGLEDEKLSIRMTGCPNGCARPYVADIGFVGRSLDQYTVFLGGHRDGTRLNKPFKDLVPQEELLPTLRPLFVLFKEERAPGESFGDFCNRVGVESLQAYAENHQDYAHAS